MACFTLYVYPLYGTQKIIVSNYLTTDYRGTALNTSPPPGYSLLQVGQTMLPYPIGVCVCYLMLIVIDVMTKLHCCKSLS